jgi:hypothetical protein
MIEYHEEKTRLLRELKVEILNQLAALHAEDPEGFLRSTEACQPIMQAINKLDLQQVPLPDKLRWELSGLLQGIDRIGQQIANLIPSLQEKLKKQWIAEKQLNVAKRRYKRTDRPMPSIFLDKKI